MNPPGCQMSKHFSAALTQHVTRLSRQASAHIVDLAIDHEIPSGPYRTSKGLHIDLHEPAESHDRLGNNRQRRKRWAGHPRRLVPTGARLVGPLIIVVGQEGEGSLRDLQERPWPVDLQALLRHSSGEIARRRHFCLDDAAGSHEGSPQDTKETVSTRRENRVP
jgi:hypothetical protein